MKKFAFIILFVMLAVQGQSYSNLEFSGNLKVGDNIYWAGTGTYEPPWGADMNMSIISDLSDFDFEAVNITAELYTHFQLDVVNSSALNSELLGFFVFLMPNTVTDNSVRLNLFDIAIANPGILPYEEASIIDKGLLAEIRFNGSLEIFGNETVEARALYDKASGLMMNASIIIDSEYYAYELDFERSYISYLEPSSSSETQVETSVSSSTPVDAMGTVDTAASTSAESPYDFGLFLFGIFVTTMYIRKSRE